jgi:hypothetical protein
MYLTEEEAKKKGCPMALENCVASKCMMWRSGTHCVKASETHRSGELKVAYKQVPHPEGAGYCGLAGKP